MFNIEEELKKLPSKPGVYIMHDEKDHIIYVGKAISLKNRVRQYFQSSRNKGVKIEQMVTHIRRFEYIVTDSELEALVLECNLIKEHHPKYNTMLMDDKTYPFIKVTTNEPFPRVMLSRKMKKDKARYFGPYTSAQAVRDTIDLIHKLYHVRSCSRSLPRDIGKERPCLNYHIKQCDAPCQGYISQEEYRKSIDEVIRFLNGNYDGILKELEEKMNGICDQMGEASPEELESMMEELGTIQDLLMAHDFYVIDSKVEEIGRAFGLDELGLDKDVTELSGGQRTKVLLAKLLLEKPDILLLDEPLTSLDVVVAEEMKQLLRSLKPGRITIFSTHILDLALDLCDEIVLLSHGELEAVEKSNLDQGEFKEKILSALREDSHV